MSVVAPKYVGPSFNDEPDDVGLGVTEPLCELDVVPPVGTVVMPDAVETGTSNCPSIPVMVVVAKDVPPLENAPPASTQSPTPEALKEHWTSRERLAPEAIGFTAIKETCDASWTMVSVENT